MVIEDEVKGATPLLLCASQGFDASARVDDLAAELNKPISAIAIGSAEGFSQADKAINSAVKNGRYVHCHLESYIKYDCMPAIARELLDDAPCTL